MDRFLSTYTNRIDSKGRVSVPAAYRTLLAKDGFDGVFMTPAPSDPAIEAGGNALIEKINAVIESHAAFSDDLLDLSMALFGESETAKIDGDGRIVLSEKFLAHAGLSDRVVFVGMGDRFRLWEPDRFAERSAQARARLHEVLSSKRAPGAGAANGDTRE